MEGSRREVPSSAREALLGAAIAEFASKGFAGARVDVIAQEAGVNKQLVYHYFGSKQGLFQAALERVRLQKMHSPLVDMLKGTLRRGVGSGVFRRDCDAVNLYISIAAISYFFFSNNHTLSAIFGRKLDTSAARARRRQHVIQFALNALRA